jgi:hypothetical protein
VNGRSFTWLLAAVPATLAGHGLAYLLTGQNQADGHHAYVVPALELSAALLFSFCAATLLRALSTPRLSTIGSSLVANAAKLALVQVALFAFIERIEGYAPSPIAYLVQIFVALLAALAIAHFTRLVRRCEHASLEAGEYLRRSKAHAGRLSVRTARRSPARALTISTGTSRFQRPPPLPSVDFS